MAYANLATSPKCLETELTNITRRHFCSLPVFLYWTCLCLLSLFGFPLSVCFDILWQLATTHARNKHATGTQIVRAKMTPLAAIFCRGNKSSSRSLARFCRRKHKILPLALRAREEKLSSTCWQVYIGTNNIAVHIKSVAKFSQHKCTIIWLLYVY